MSDDDREGQAPRRPHPLTQHTYQSLIDQQFAQAQAEGKFDNLPGAGRPQDLEDDANVPAEDRIGYRMLKGAGFSLPWVEARRDIDEERRRIDGWLVHANDRWSHLDAASREKLRAEYRQKLDGLRRQIVDYNLRAPVSAGHLRGVEMERELARLGDK